MSDSYSSGETRWMFVMNRFKNSVTFFHFHVSSLSTKKKMNFSGLLHAVDVKK